MKELEKHKILFTALTAEDCGTPQWHDTAIPEELYQVIKNALDSFKSDVHKIGPKVINPRSYGVRWTVFEKLDKTRVAYRIKIEPVEADESFPFNEAK